MRDHLQTQKNCWFCIMCLGSERVRCGWLPSFRSKRGTVCLTCKERVGRSTPGKGVNFFQPRFVGHIDLIVYYTPTFEIHVTLLPGRIPTRPIVSKLTACGHDGYEYDVSTNLASMVLIGSKTVRQASCP